MIQCSCAAHACLCMPTQVASALATLALSGIVLLLLCIHIRASIAYLLYIGLRSGVVSGVKAGFAKNYVYARCLGGSKGLPVAFAASMFGQVVVAECGDVKSALAIVALRALLCSPYRSRILVIHYK